MVETENHASSQTKRGADKSKKKKKKKEREKDKSSRKKDEGISAKSKKKSNKKKRKYSRSHSSDSSESSKHSRSRSRSRERSGQRSRRKLSKDERKRGRSSSSKEKNESRRRSRRSDSYSSSSSNDRSKSQTLRSGSRSRSSHRSDQKRSEHRSVRSPSYSRSRSSDSSLSERSRSRSKHRQADKRKKVSVANKIEKSSSSKMKLQDIQRKSGGSATRDRSLSRHSSSERSYISLSPEDSRRESRPTSGSRKSKDERSQVKSSRKQFKAVKSRSPSLLQRKVDVQNKDSIAAPSPSQKRGQPGRKSSDVIDPYPHLERTKDTIETKEKSKDKSKDEQQTSKQQTETSQRETCKGDDKNKRRPSYRDADSSSDERSKTQSKNSSLNSGSVKDGKRRYQGRTSPKDAKTHVRGNRDRRSPSGSDRSRSRSFSSDGSYSDGSSSSYSLSGSRSYSYSSYSSYTVSGSTSDSDDSYYKRKNSECKSDKSKRHTKQSDKASTKDKKRSRTSEMRKKEVKPDDEDGDSDSDIDTGIYEISRDHIEMYMDNKSYQIKKTDEDTPLKSKKRKHLEEDESSKKDNPENTKKQRLLDDEEKTKPVLFPPAYKESQKMSKPVSESSSVLKPATQRKFKDDIPQETETKVTLPVPPSQALSVVDRDVAKPAKDMVSSYHESYIQSSVPDVPFPQSLIDPSLSNTGANQSVVPQQSIVPDIGPYHQSVNPQNISQQQHPARKVNELTLLPKSELEVNANAMTLPTVPDPGSHKPIGLKLKMFSPDQLAVIKSISKQFGQVHPKTSHVDRECSVKTSDTEKAHYDPKTPKDYDAMKGERSSEVGNQGQGHHIGVIITQQSRDSHGEIKQLCIDQTEDSGGSGFLASDLNRERFLGSGHMIGGIVPLGEGKAATVSIDYKHGQNITIESKTREVFVANVLSNVTYEQSGTRISCDMEHVNRPAALQGEKHARSHDVLDVRKQTSREKHHHSCRDSGEMPPTKSHHGRKGQRSHDGGHVSESSKGSTYYYSTRLHQKESIDENKSTRHSGHIDEIVSTNKINVIDYQHGRSDNHNERSTREKTACDKRQDRHHDGHRDNRHRSSFERHQEQGDNRASYYHGRPNQDRGHTWGTDRDRYHSRSSATHSDRYHGRTHSRSSNRSGSKSNQGIVVPRESNPFHKLVSSNKEMQLASLHREGKWGYDQSPEVKKSSSRSWWI